MYILQRVKCSLTKQNTFFHNTGKEKSDEYDLILAALSAHLLEAMTINGTKELSVKSYSNGKEKELSIQLNNVAKQEIH